MSQVGLGEARIELRRADCQSPRRPGRRFLLTDTRVYRIAALIQPRPSRLCTLHRSSTRLGSTGGVAVQEGSNCCVSS